MVIKVFYTLLNLLVIFLFCPTNVENLKCKLKTICKSEIFLLVLKKAKD